MPHSVITITSKKETKERWIITLEVDGVVFTVQVGKEYWQKLTGGAELPERLVERTFRFLLVREPVGAILRTFDLALVAQYFPEYEREIREGESK